MRRALVWLAAGCGGCGVPAAPAPAPASAPAAPAFVLRQWTAVATAGGDDRGVVVDTASAWRHERAALGPVAAALADGFCTFAIERIVVLQLTGPFAEEVAHAWHEEEGVDVVTVTPAVVEGLAPRRLLHAFVVPARNAQLAVVVRAPAADGQVTETTLVVASGR